MQFHIGQAYPQVWTTCECVETRLGPPRDYKGLCIGLLILQCKAQLEYCIRGIFGGGFNLVVWQIM